MKTETLEFVIGSSFEWHHSVEVLIVLLGGMTTFLRWLESRRNEKRSGYQRWIMICTLLVVLLGGVGIIFHRREIRTNAALNAFNEGRARQQESKIVSLKSNLAEGTRNAEAAHREIARGKKLVAEAERRAEEALHNGGEETLARLALEEKLQDRHLFGAQQEELARRLRFFPQLPIGVSWTDSGGQETAGLADDMIRGIGMAGVKIPNRELMIGVYVRGVHLRVGHDRLAEAEMIAGFLVESGLSHDPVPAWFDDNPQVLSIVVGAKM